jgi:hypothetical protein
MARLIAFAFSSVGIVLLSRKSLRDPRSHGFFRFFAFEAILGLVLVNLKRWYRDPLSARQLASWALLTASAPLAGHGFYLLRVVGKPRAGLEGTENLLPGFENTSQLVTVGAYRFIRHPLYSSLLGLTWGVFLKDPSRRGALLAILASVSLLATARAEESENARRFGPAYADYARRMRMLIPFVL